MNNRKKIIVFLSLLGAAALISTSFIKVEYYAVFAWAVASGAFIAGLVVAMMPKKELQSKV